MSFLPFTIDFDSSSTDHIIGGFPFIGSLKTIHHDGSPVPNIKIQVKRAGPVGQIQRTDLIENWKPKMTL